MFLEFISTTTITTLFKIYLKLNLKIEGPIFLMFRKKRLITINNWFHKKIENKNNGPYLSGPYFLISFLNI